MSDAVIQVRGLGKRYQLNGTRKPYRTVRESVTELFSAPFRRPSKAARREDNDNTFWALKDVNFDVHAGEVVGIIGRNGAGKSTLLKTLCRITDPTEGEIEMNGRVGSLLEVGTGFHPELTGRENIFLNGAILGMTRAEVAGKFDEIVSFAETEKFLDTPVKFYSSGMYTRLAFAVAAHLEPEILIVDEVLAVGDVAFQRKCMGKMQDVADEGRTVLFVSHTMSAVQQLCSRVILMRSGQVHANGEPAEVINEYLGDAAISADGTFDLTTHAARGIHHQPVIKRIVLTNGDAKPTGQFFPDDTMNVELAITAPDMIRDARVAVAFEDTSNRRITTLASYFGGNEIGDLSGDSVVRCSLDKLRLGAGRDLISESSSDK